MELIGGFIAKREGPTQMSRRKVTASKLLLADVFPRWEEPAPALRYTQPLCFSIEQYVKTNPANQTVAGVFALLNDFRLSQNKTTLGFINPLIYSTAASGFNDIKAGTNPGCGTRGK